MPQWCDSLVDTTTSGPAIEIFKAYAAAIDKLSNAVKFPNSDPATLALFKRAFEDTDTAYTQSYDPSYKPGDCLTVEQFAQKLEDIDAEIVTKEAEIVTDFVTQIKQI